MTFSCELRKDDQEQWVGWSPLKDPQWGSWDETAKKYSILKISEAEFGLIKVLFYHFILLSRIIFMVLLWRALGFEKENSIKCIDYLVKMFSTNLDCPYPRRGRKLQHTRLEAYLEPSRTFAMELFLWKWLKFFRKKLHRGCSNRF